MKIITWNTWHGVEPKGFAFFRDLESVTEKAQRMRYQMDLIARESPDVVFLQELNPTRYWSQVFAQELGYREIHQTVISGVKAFGRGIPNNLSFGLTILVRPPIQIRKVKTVNLTFEPWGFVNDYFSLQGGEWRSALIGEMTHPTWGSIFLINTHLHHGYDLKPQFLQFLREKFYRRRLFARTFQSLYFRLKSSGRKRMRELRRLEKELRKLNIVGSRTVEPAIFAGDLNCVPESSEVKAILDWGFQDTHRLAGIIDPHWTWDTQHNSQARDYGSTESTGIWDEIHLEPEIRDEVVAEFEKHIAQRRLDYVFLNQGLADRKVETELIATEAMPNGRSASDHFGIVCRVQMK